jgi:nitrogen fixation/metabolism regulation signal transduction histidine kinase
MGANRGYKRSWKNLLLDRNYQLVFTLFLVLTAALFVTGLGFAVMHEAGTATTTAVQDVDAKAEQGFIDADKARTTIHTLERRKTIFTMVLVGVGLALCLGLFAYGIKMTHKIAGPLFKISLYCDKVIAGKFDKVYNLRKGDQLVDFYDNFRQAHEALRHREEVEVACLKRVVAAAEGQDLPPEAKAELEVMRELLAKKEASLG